MGQGEILKVLEKERLATSSELAEDIGLSRKAIQNSLNRMLNFDVERMIINVGYTKRSYVWKIKGDKIPKEKLNKYHITNE